MKTILFPRSGAAMDPSSLELASRVARVFSSHINVVHVQRNIVEQVATMTMAASQERHLNTTTGGKDEDHSVPTVRCRDGSLFPGAGEPRGASLFQPYQRRACSA